MKKLWHKVLPEFWLFLKIYLFIKKNVIAVAFNFSFSNFVSKVVNVSNYIL